jgi:hypothetical protein
MLFDMPNKSFIKYLLIRNEHGNIDKGFFNIISNWKRYVRQSHPSSSSKRQSIIRLKGLEEEIHSLEKSRKTHHDGKRNPFCHLASVFS